MVQYVWFQSFSDFGIADKGLGILTTLLVVVVVVGRKGTV